MLDKIILEDILEIKSAVKGDSFEQKKVLVTGGAGFIGSWLCDVLVSYGSHVVAVDDFSTGRRRNIDHLISNSKFELIERDASKFITESKFDYIFHLAAHASPDEYQTKPIETLQASSFGTANIAEIARRSDATMLFASTSEVYGDAEIVPTPESYWAFTRGLQPKANGK